HSHPWVFASEVDRMEGEPVPGQLVDILDHRGKYLATGYFNPKSQIVLRVVSYTPLAAMDLDFFVERFRRCRRYRERFLGEADSYRAVYGEADLLPGLVVDK